MTTTEITNRRPEADLHDQLSFGSFHSNPILDVPELSTDEAARVFGDSFYGRNLERTLLKDIVNQAISEGIAVRDVEFTLTHEQAAELRDRFADHPVYSFDKEVEILGTADDGNLRVKLLPSMYEFIEDRLLQHELRTDTIYHDLVGEDAIEQFNERRPQLLRLSREEGARIFSDSPLNNPDAEHTLLTGLTNIARRSSFEQASWKMGIKAAESWIKSLEDSIPARENVSDYVVFERFDTGYRVSVGEKLLPFMRDRLEQFSERSSRHAKLGHHRDYRGL